MGNSRIPDKTWTSWTPPFSDPGNARLEASGYRYVQFKVALNSANLPQSPRFTRLTAYYLQNNLKPRIHALSISRVTKKTGKNEKESEAVQSGFLRVHWKADDPNKDRLQAAVELLASDGLKWIPYRDHVEDGECLIDPRMVADGEYQLRVRVDDGLSNAGDSALNATRISGIFTIDSTAPELESVQVDKGVLVMKVRDKTSPVAEVSYSIDRELWLPLAPEDGLNDSLMESYRFPLSRVAGKGLLYIRFRDEAGNFKIHQQKI